MAGPFTDEPECLEDETPLPALQQMVEWVAKKWVSEPLQYQRVHQCLSQRWDRLQSLSAAMTLMEKYGVTISAEEQARLAQMEEGKQIEALVSKMPPQSADDFQKFFHELQLLVSTAAKVRQSLEKGNVEGTQIALAEADATGISQFMLKMALVQAGSEVAHQRADYKVWCKAMDGKMSKIIRGQEDAMQAQRKLASAQATLNAFQAGQNDKAKRVIMNFAAGSEKGLLAGTFHSWMMLVKNEQREKEIRAEYEERIIMAETKLFDYKTAHLKGARSVMSKKAGDVEMTLKREIYDTWKVEIVGNKRTAEDIANLKALEDKLAHSSKQQAENTKRVIARMNGNSDSALIGTVFTGWLTFHKEYLKNKEMEDRVKASEQHVQEFLKKKGDSAKAVLHAASSGSDTAVIFECWTAWTTYMTEVKHEAEMAELLQRGDSKFASLTGKGKMNGMTAMEKASYHIDFMYYLRHFIAWKLDTRQMKIQRTYHAKIDGKRRQLQGVQDMFRKFANELESGLKAGDNFNTRDWREAKTSKMSMRGSEGGVKLPDINQKPNSGRVSGRSGAAPGYGAVYPAQGAYPGMSY
jgi:hypothetical protein